MVTEYITKEQAIAVVKEAIANIVNSDSETVSLTDLEIEIEMTITDYTDAADVAPVIYAKWKFVAGPDEDNNLQFMCDNCGAGDVHAADVTVPYCWRCGARMDGEKNG